MPNRTLILPYSVKEKARKKPFTLDMEISAILCSAEAQRKKPGILDASFEKVTFISKLHYPIWAVPWKDSFLLVDGLNIFRYTFPYVKIPDVEPFTEKVKRSLTDKEQFRNTLRQHAQTFVDPEVTQNTLEAIFAEENILSSLAEYFEQISQFEEKQSEPVALVPPKLNEKAASEKAEKAVDLWGQIQFDIKGLQYASGVLNEGTSYEEEMIFREIEHLRGLYDAKIAPLRPLVEKKIEKLLLERDAKIAKLNKTIERKLIPKLREKRRHERELERLERSLIECKKRLEKGKRRGNDISASKWEHKIKVCQSKLSQARRALQSVSELIEMIRKQGEREVQDVKDSFKLLIEGEKRKILDIEASRDLEIKSRKRQIEEMRADTSLIVEQIWRLIELKRSEASRIEENTIPHPIENIMLLCFPFYLARYKTKAKARYLTFPPVVVMDFKGIVRWLQKAFHRFSLQSRIRLLLRPKSTALEEMLGKALLERIRSDNILDKAVCELGFSNNILHSSDFRETLAKGTEELQKEGWISREEKEALLKTYL